jgi:hypothetical protein
MLCRPDSGLYQMLILYYLYVFQGAETFASKVQARLYRCRSMTCSPPTDRLKIYNSLPLFSVDIHYSMPSASNNLDRYDWD